MGFILVYHHGSNAWLGKALFGKSLFGKSLFGKSLFGKEPVEHNRLVIPAQLDLNFTASESVFSGDSPH